MYRRYFVIVVSALLLWSSSGYADASLESALGLDINQARQVQDIQKKYRPQFSASRQELNREERKLRRARIERDSAQIAQQESIVEKHLAELKHIRMNENEEIRRVLTPEQRLKFEKVLQQRKETVGSSRDDKRL